MNVFRRPRYRWLMVLIFSFGCWGCVATTPRLELRDPNVDLVWPPAPEVPRIRFLRAISAPEEIVPQRGTFHHVMDFITGDSPLSFSFYTPYGIAADGDAVIYVADSTASLVHCYNLAERNVTYILQAGEDTLASPVGVAVDQEGNLYITDSVNAKVYKFKRNGDFIGTVSPPPAGFGRPAGIAINSRGEKYVADVLAHKLYVFDGDDRFLREFPNPRQGEELNYPTNVAIDRQDNVYVTDSMNFKVRIYDLDGNFNKGFGQIGDAPGSFAKPKGIAVDSDLNIYVVDAEFDNFQIFNQNGRLLLFVGRTGKGAGEFYLPSGIYIDKNDRIYVSDTYNRRIQIFQYLKEGAKK